MKNLKSFASNFDKQKVIIKNVHAWYINKVFIISLLLLFFLEWLEKCMLTSTQNFMNSDGQ
jgi:hypothetical protein